jgi:hypothetical protein
MDAASPVAAASRAADGISDQRFATQLEAIKKLKQFLFDEKIPLQADVLEDIDLGSLNNLKYMPDGRSPTEDEWKALDRKLAGLTALLTPALRWKLRIRELRFFFMTIPVFFMSLTVAATFALALLMTFGDGTSMFFVASYVITLLVWTLSQGALGACAFLCVTATVHALKGRSSSANLYPAIDVTDENILSIRVIVGALFALLIALPICGPSISVIYKTFLASPSVPTAEELIIVLVPFMFGFSTTLVLAIFNRIITAISALFGITGETTARSE